MPKGIKTTVPEKEAKKRTPKGEGEKHEHHHTDRELLELIYHQNKQILKNQETMLDLTKLNAAVADNTTATNAAVAALGSADNQSSIDAITAAVVTNTANLNNAVTPPSTV